MRQINPTAAGFNVVDPACSHLKLRRGVTSIFENQNWNLNQNVS